MVDWIKLEAQHPDPKLLLNSFDFTRDVNIYTAEIKTKFDKATIGRDGYSVEAMTVKLYPSGRMWLTGSLHKLWHGNNYSSFTYPELKACIDYVCNQFGIIPENWNILKMEYGVNISTSFETTSFLNRLIGIKYHPFNRMKPTQKVSGHDCYFTDWAAKIYNKGKQYNLSYPLLRIEKKVIKARYLQKLKINTLADLTPSNLSVLGNDLLQMLKLVLVNDKSINLNQLTSRQQIALANYRNPNYWQNLSRYAAPKARIRFEQMSSNYGSENYYADVLELTHLKLIQLNPRGNICKAVKETKQKTNAIPEVNNNSLTTATFANRF
ncbi:hypothetical protein ACFOG5_07795 [Pedobacter fastidiosus]|uniref:Replication-associated protein G2P N-terminal domain-containing protein n=1 Tax=Pedobacter fastidiosus TaxID=2765361 RepID=A0ABR7KQC2_9SPHI|nr:hypothetical protein [Pedobacter fastidiosus]MBC6109942.1 hypothetical protein [Pedobacter fastidiosus]